MERWRKLGRPLVLGFMVALIPMPASSLTTVTAPSFTVGRGDSINSLKVFIPTTTGSPTFTIKIYSSTDSYTASVYTRYNYLSGTEIFDSNATNCTSGSTPLCWSIRTLKTLKFTITPEATTGYVSDGESLKSNAYGVFPSSAFSSFGSITGGSTTGINFTAFVNKYPAGAFGTIRFYHQYDSYTSVIETATAPLNGTTAVPIQSADGITGFKMDWRAEEFLSGGVIWLRSDWADKSAFASSTVFLKPNDVSNVVPTVINSTTVNLTWEHAPGAYQFYYVYTSTNGRDVSSWKGTTTSNNFQVTGLTAGTPYYFLIANVGSGKYARTSNYIPTAITATPGSVPNAVSSMGLNKSSQSDNSLVVSWTHSGSTPSTFIIQYSMIDGNWTDSQTVLGSETTTVISNLNYARYYVRIGATNTYGQSPWSVSDYIDMSGIPNTVTLPIAQVATETMTVSIHTNSFGRSTTPSFSYGLSADASDFSISFSPISSGDRQDTATVTGLLPGKKYFIFSSSTNGISTTPGGLYSVTTTPIAPSDFQSTRDQNSITLSLSALTPGSGYMYYYNFWAEYQGIGVGTDCLDETRNYSGRIICTINGLEANRTYQIFYSVRITGGDFGNGTSLPRETSIATLANVSSVSLSIVGITTAVFNRISQLIVSVSTPGKVTLYANNKPIPGCLSRVTTSSFLCEWKPNLKGVILLKAILKPKSTSYAVVTSNPLNVMVTRRTGTR